MDFPRRRFLKTTGLGFLAMGLAPSFLLRAVRATESKPGRVLVVLFQRGGMDGLNAVIPFKESAYFKMSPSIAIAEPAAGEDRAINLDGFYALHPALASLKPLYDQGHLAIIHARGRPTTRVLTSTRRTTGDRHSGSEKHSRRLAQPILAGRDAV
jgi:uncharacterized protein (DUF1501 family)